MSASGTSIAADTGVSTGAIVQSPARIAWRRLRRDPLAMSGLAVLALLVMAALLGLLLTHSLPAFDPGTVRLTDKLLPPLSEATSLVAQGSRPVAGIYWLGTDEFGRDVLSRMLQGAFVSLSIGLIAISIAVAVGLTVGAVSGYAGHLRMFGVSVDSILMRFTDAMLCFPAFFLILTVVALLPASIYNIMIVIGLTSWMGTARFVRAEVLSLKQRDFVVAAVAAGLSELRIVTVHVLPNAMAPVLVTATIGIATAILTESALSFLGFGVQPPDATWGNVLADGKAFVFDAPWLFVVPGTAILVVVLAFNLLGEGLREALNPRLDVEL